jgi:glycosyltransferase involved in cell wall biosynthesis
MGGVETHCQEIYPRLAEQGFTVTVYGRKPYIPDRPYDYRGVRLLPLWAPKQKHLEAIFHTTYGVIKVALNRSRYDLLHLHCVGPALLTPLARLLGLKVVLTTQGPDYDRQKWGGLAKSVLRLGERWGASYAHRVIAVSHHIQSLLRQLYGAESVYIPNGVEPPERVPPGETLAQFGLEPERYLLQVGRIVPEKGWHDLLEAYSGLSTDWKLALVGAADHEDEYSRGIKKRAAEVEGVVMTGFQKGRALAELYGNAGLFVLPSYHEGLPHVLLEAMSYGRPMVVSDIPANMEVALDQEVFKVGDQTALRNKLREFLDNPDLFKSAEIMDLKARRLKEEFNWDVIAAQTAEVLREAARPGRSRETDPVKPAS